MTTARARCPVSVIIKALNEEARIAAESDASARSTFLGT